MATLLFTALGSVLGGPLGGALGALAGRQIDALISPAPTREGPRLKELAVTTSSYGSAIAAHYGRMRVAGSIIWSTDLVEHRQKEGGGKGKPSTVTYSYTVSFAVALSSREVLSIGRVWADGNLLRGQAGDLKVGGTMRLHSGGYDQLPDPLIESAETPGQCPAFRGLAYAVFEDLQLEEFGNRIPALTFEILADTGELDLARLFAGRLDDVDARVALPGLAGLSCEGPLSEVLAQLDPVFPLDCDAAAGALTIARERLQAAPIALAEAAVATADDDFGGAAGFTRRRGGPGAGQPGLLRYYDVDRDFQPGVQRAPGRPGPGAEPRSIELPAALAAADARRLIAGAAKRAGLARESLSWRTSEVDPAVAPGAVVTVPGHPGRWRVDDWEWRDKGVELTLVRLPPAALAAADPAGGDSGRANPPADHLPAPTAIAAFELPWDGLGSGDAPALFAAASSAGAGWKGAMLHVDRGDGQLVPLGPTGRSRATIGTAATALPPASHALADRGSAVTVELLAPDMLLIGATARQLAQGANRALIGAEVVQFGTAAPLGAGRWRLERLLRGRGGTEAAIPLHAAGERFILLDGTPVALDPGIVGTSPAAQIAALGLGDAAPATSEIAGRGATLRPLCPVHPRSAAAGGGLRLAWARRARGAWLWPDGVDAPLHEQSEAYEVGYGPVEAPIARWTVTAPELVLSAATVASLALALPGGTFQVRQVGSYALSDPLRLITLP
ncbi:MAG: phage tail protein [Novosphingobium sp.]